MTTKLILLRHGESIWNKDNLFTGWADVPLSEKGRSEAIEAGRLLIGEGYEVDLAHTSLLQRAIDTLDLALVEMKRSEIPVKRHWRLNERHYGALQGRNKKQMVAEHGAEQVFEWRRSYDVRPPPLESRDGDNVAHDQPYPDIPARAVPAGECLRDVYERVVLYWRNAILPDIRDGKRVILSAHGNSLRALVKHLEKISDEEISGLNIPTGIPLVYELDDRFGVSDHYYLGDPAVVEDAAAAVANQASRC